MILNELDDDEFWLNGDTCAVVLQVSSVEPFICLFVITYMNNTTNNRNTLRRRNYHSHFLRQGTITFTFPIFLLIRIKEESLFTWTTPPITVAHSCTITSFTFTTFTFQYYFCLSELRKCNHFKYLLFGFTIPLFFQSCVKYPVSVWFWWYKGTPSASLIIKSAYKVDIFDYKGTPSAYQKGSSFLVPSCSAVQWWFGWLSVTSLPLFFHSTILFLSTTLFLVLRKSKIIWFKMSIYKKFVL